jgi:hypothetical protein
MGSAVQAAWAHGSTRAKPLAVVPQKKSLLYYDG